MADKTITSANSIFVLSAPGIFTAGQQIQGYASDKAFLTEAITKAETMMGVDGTMSAGFIHAVSVQTVTLQADSPSRDIFNRIIQVSNAAREIYFLSGYIELPATKEKFTLTRGVLKTYKEMPDAMQVLQPIDYMIDWESVARSPI